MHACGEFHGHYMAQVSIEAPQMGFSGGYLFIEIFTRFYSI
jgi:hypothetical protein